MCGRYTLHDAKAFAAAVDRLGIKAAEKIFRQRYNVAPTQTMPVVLRREDSPAPALELMEWGPRYLQWESEPQLSINARSEKATFTRFKYAVQRRRCLVPANGFFEWDRSTKPGTPYLFSVIDSPAFWIAGAWEETTDEFAEAFLVFTTEPNDLVGRIHDRMPAILDDAAALAWLTPGELTAARIREICATMPADRMTSIRVSQAVNNARNDTPECIQAA